MCTGLEPLLAGLGSASTLSTAAALGGLAFQAYSASKAGDSQKKASEQAAASAKATADAADQAFNKANAKKPNVQGLYADNAAAAKGGVGGTLLTGPQGVDPKTLLLGKTTLLGG